MISLKFVGLDDLGRYYREVGKATTVATARAINRTAQSARTKASKAIRDQVALKAGYVNERLKVTRASPTRLEARISTPMRGLLLTRFPHRKLRKGVSVKVKTAGGYKLIRGGFLVNLRGGNIGVAVRPSGSGRKFKVLHGPSVSQVFNTVREDIAPAVLDNYKTTLSREIDFALRGVK